MPSFAEKVTRALQTVANIQAQRQREKDRRERRAERERTRRLEDAARRGEAEAAGLEEGLPAVDIERKLPSAKLRTKRIFSAREAGIPEEAIAETKGRPGDLPRLIREKEQETKVKQRGLLAKETNTRRLNLEGGAIGVPRLEGETNPQYAKRITAEELFRGLDKRGRDVNLFRRKNETPEQYQSRIVKAERARKVETGKEARKTKRTEDLNLEAAALGLSPRGVEETNIDLKKRIGVAEEERRTARGEKIDVRAEERFDKRQAALLKTRNVERLKGDLVRFRSRVAGRSTPITTTNAKGEKVKSRKIILSFEEKVELRGEMERLAAAGMFPKEEFVPSYLLTFEEIAQVTQEVLAENPEFQTPSFLGRARRIASDFFHKGAIGALAPLLRGEEKERALNVLLLEKADALIRLPKPAPKGKKLLGTKPPKPTTQEELSKPISQRSKEFHLRQAGLR
ncbi:hypothetical protein LCGC14_0394180 [marine sediment metagenome]|uniref:Uncharacterized protein n=1 Tax=marine sediment metagenome TaxID=412755 RepID=A0A0F9W7P8_9ZZZZ